MRPYRAEHSHKASLLPPSLPWAAPAPRILELPGRKPVAKGSIGLSVEGAKDGPASGPQPSTMQHHADSSLCRTGVRGTSRQGKEAGPAWVRWAQETPMTRRTFPSQRRLPVLSWVWVCPSF